MAELGDAYAAQTEQYALDQAVPDPPDNRPCYCSTEPSYTPGIKRLTRIDERCQRHRLLHPGNVISD